MAVVEGYIEKIKYRNEENGWSILSVASDGEDYVLVGTFAMIGEGEFISAEGTMKVHPVYGEQLAVEHYEIRTPEDSDGALRYLSSGAVKGIGEALAKRIVKRFKNDTLRIMEEEPERLAEVKGISERMAMEIGAQVSEKKDMRDAMLFLTKYGIGMNLAVRIYKQYGDSVYSIIRDNPYQLADDMTGVGFRIADEIASKAGIRADSEYRIRCGILYTLGQAEGQGHLYLPEAELVRKTAELLGLPEEGMRMCLMDLRMDRRIVVKRIPDPERERRPAEVPEGTLPDGTLPDTALYDEAMPDGAVPEETWAVYPASSYYTELSTAAMLRDLDIRSDEQEERILSVLRAVEEEDGITFDALQKRAVTEAARSGLLIITGGPGTGKTTTINAIIRYFERQEAEILLAAPTGRAAKRMTEATGHEARTIHRLLEISGMPSDDRQGGGGSMAGMHFERNELMPLEADCVIIDEMSMVDIRLMNALLKAVSVGTHLILVGDSDQLPSVGPGNVLRDMIASGAFNVVRLEKIYRQAEESDIIVNAHRMIRGERIDLAKRSRDFLFIRQDTAEGVIRTMLTLLREKLPDYVHASADELQILTPMRKGVLGVENLNRVLQEALNPPRAGRTEKEIGGTLFRTGDKVMQIKNDYDRGVYNGDIGILTMISQFAETFTVRFDEGREVEYAFGDAEELELAYAVTIHKSQGSEYPAVIIPVWQGPRMLLTRNLLYTAVTRARSCVAMVGIPQYFYDMAGNTRELRRYTGLADRIRELYA